MGERRAGNRLEFQWPITYAAGLAVRFYKDLEELRDQLGVTRGSRRWRASCANVSIGHARRQ